MESTISDLAPVRPAPADAGLRYHLLHQGSKGNVWSWHGGVWKRGEMTYLPEQLAELGWRYVQPVRADDAPAPPAPPAPPAEAMAGTETMLSRDGTLIEAHRVSGKVRLENRTVTGLVQEALAMRGLLQAFKAQAFDDIASFMQELSASYGRVIAGRSGGTTLESFDGCMKVVVSSANNITFGAELSVARDLIDECVREWSDGANDHLRTLVLDAFKVGATGGIQVDRILGLRRLNIDDPKWQTAMAAISDAIRVANSKRYIRFYVRANVDAEWAQIALDASRV